jgi:hypothetical protein
MLETLIIYSSLITIVSLFVFLMNQNLKRELKSELDHSKELRATILKYLTESNKYVV